MQQRSVLDDIAVRSAVGRTSGLRIAATRMRTGGAGAGWGGVCGVGTDMPIWMPLKTIASAGRMRSVAGSPTCDEADWSGGAGRTGGRERQPYAEHSQSHGLPQGAAVSQACGVDTACRMLLRSV